MIEVSNESSSTFVEFLIDTLMEEIIPSVRRSFEFGNPVEAKLEAVGFMY